MVLTGQVVQMVSESAVAGQMAACASGLVVAAVTGQKGIAAGMITATEAMMTQQRLRIVPAKAVMLTHPRERPLMGVPATVPRREGIAVVVTGRAGVRPRSPLATVVSVESATGMRPHAVRAGRKGMASVVLRTTKMLSAIHPAAIMAVALPAAEVSTAKMTAAAIMAAATVESATPLVTTPVMAAPAAKIAAAKVSAAVMAAPATKTVTTTEAAAMPSTKAAATEVTATTETAPMPTTETAPVAAAKATAVPAATAVAATAATPMAQRGCGIGQAEQKRGDECRTDG
jgi:hypothetical protein